MPITPLHFGVIAPYFHWSRSWLALTSFTLVQLWIDYRAISAWLSGTRLPSHDEPWHTLHGALFFAGFISLLGILSWRWIAGAFYGAVTHIYLDGLVHPEMQPFVDTERGNPIYIDGMVPVSLALLPLTIWLVTLIVLITTRSVSGVLSRIRRPLAASAPPSSSHRAR